MPWRLPALGVRTEHTVAAAIVDAGVRDPEGAILDGDAHDLGVGVRIRGPNRVW